MHIQAISHEKQHQVGMGAASLVAACCLGPKTLLALQQNQATGTAGTATASCFFFSVNQANPAAPSPCQSATPLNTSSTP